VKINLYPKENAEQMALARYLDMRGFLWCHVPNEGRFDVAYLAKRKRLGVKKGFPDNLIFNQICICKNELLTIPVIGMAIELKRQKDGTTSKKQTSKEQINWLDNLTKYGWIAIVAYGAQDAIKQIEKAYGKGRLS
jgi:hypothetical protein